MTERSCLAIVLAAGEGTRMRSSRPKVLHEVAGLSMLSHVLKAASQSGASRLAVVIGPSQPDTAKAIRRIAPDADIVEQRERLGTAHAVLAARAAIERGVDDVLILFGDTPLVRPQSLQHLRQALAEGAAVALLGFRAADPAGYGRLLIGDDGLRGVREDKDATPQEKEIALCNAGLMALAGDKALAILDRIGNSNSKREFYLTDAVAVARDMGLKAVAIGADEDDVRGINTKTQLAEAEAIMQKRLRAAALEAGVTLVAPETVFLSADTAFGNDITVEPNVVFGPGVSIEDGATIRAFTHLEGAHVGKGARVGPYARLRPGADLGADVHIGNFVEIKAATVEAGAKANHLAYIGDARVGEGSNIGAGTITCNYDGAAKHRTDIGRNVFVGSNSALVAPIKIGDGSYIGSGSVITRDVPEDSLALERSQQTVKPGWAKRLRDLKALTHKKP
jgi:bifunctional UDP-N-acetylglucosamine pyrophosphorylase/glucosamine-1-phosphate N-acetyltransferase